MSFYDDGDENRMEFADPGGRSALRVASKRNPRIYPCPQCDESNKLTIKDVNLHYVCDSCANQNEGRGY